MMPTDADNPNIVDLGYAEVARAATVGVQRRLHALRRVQQPNHAIEAVAPVWDIDIEGAAAECAVAKWLGVYWDPVVDRSDKAEGDVAGLHVRWTRHPAGRLILHKSDPEGGVFVLVTSPAPMRYHLRGWILAADGWRGEWWEDPGTGRPAFFVPVDALQPMETVPARTVAV